MFTLRYGILEMPEITIGVVCIKDPLLKNYTVDLPWKIIYQSQVKELMLEKVDFYKATGKLYH